MRLMLTMVLSLAAVAAINQAATAQAAPTADSLYALVFTRGPAWEDGKPTSQQFGLREHSANLSRLRAEGRIVMGGRFGDYGLILIRVLNRAEALGMLASDSATARGVFKAELNPWATLYEGQVIRPR